MAEHAVLSASGSSRWLECTPSARLEETVPDQKSIYSEEGTTAHSFAENTARLYLGLQTREQCEANTTALSAKSGKAYDMEMIQATCAYGKLVETLFNNAKAFCPDPHADLEVKVDYSEWVPEGFGTGDCVIIADDWLDIIDFKYGKGKLVFALNNTQMRLYALGALRKYEMLYDIKHIRMTIHQPRVSEEPSSEEITVEELLKWAEEYVKPRAALAFKGEGDFRPSDSTCQFCRVKATCKARATQNLTVFDEAPSLLLLDVDEIGEILAKAKDIKGWLSDLEEYVISVLSKGEPVAGWKMVAGRSNRTYADQVKVAETLSILGFEDEVIFKPRELITITAADKAFGKPAMKSLEEAGLIIKPEGKPTLAPASDPRQPVSTLDQILNAFGDEGE